MFGYVTINRDSLPEEQKRRFKSVYCGLCHVLGRDFGQSGRLTISYDMTFLGMLLQALYEPDEKQHEIVCPARPWKKEFVVYSEATAYAAEMNIAYAYFKARDDASDDKSARGQLLSKALEGRYARIRRKYPQKCACIEASIARLSQIEKEKAVGIDAPANAMAELFGTVFAWKDDFWQEPLKVLGGAIGRFVYICDAYEDREADEKRGLYNPLSAYASREDYEQFVHRVLTMVIAEGVQAFELLPLTDDADILRNVLYSGIWSRYGLLQRKPEETRKKQALPCTRNAAAKENRQ